MTQFERSIASIIRAERKNASMTQKDFAFKLNVNYLTYREYERGNISMPLRIFFKACLLLELDPTETGKKASDIAKNNNI
ncbi:MAG: helix-turn-helix transcriptional regulator [Erysipelotrichaceae bacterium]|nr:helix-turn-helix transcriptional regulator [Erysipelotrichaceae bacterium]